MEGMCISVSMQAASSPLACWDWVFSCRFPPNQKGISPKEEAPRKGDPPKKHTLTRYKRRFVFVGYLHFGIPDLIPASAPSMHEPPGALHPYEAGGLGSGI